MKPLQTIGHFTQGSTHLYKPTIIEKMLKLLEKKVDNDMRIIPKYERKLARDHVLLANKTKKKLLKEKS